MKPSHRFSLFPCLLYVFLATFSYIDINEFYPRISITETGRDPLPITEKIISTAGENSTSIPDANEGLLDAVPVTAPATFSSERIYPMGSSGVQVLGLPLVEIGSRPPVKIHSQGLQEFISYVVNGQSQQLVGVYIEDVLALPVVQQPDEDFGYVDSISGTVTQFQSAARQGVTGLLAHNYLSGELFFNLKKEQEVNLIYGDGLVARYLVTDIQSYQKLAGDIRNSNYVDLTSGEKLSTSELFLRVYSGGDKVTFQTCIKKGSNWSWGRIFIIATPLPGVSS
jgi:hypothetical protein